MRLCLTEKGANSGNASVDHYKRILKLDRLRLRGMSGASDEFTLAAAVQNLRRLAKLTSHGPPTTG